MYHPLLEQQIRKYFPQPGALPKELEELFGAISQSYSQYETQQVNEARGPQSTDASVKHVFENTDEVLFTVDMATSKVVYISAACNKVYGYSPADFYNNPQLWEAVIYPDDRPVARKQTASLQRGDRVFNHYRIVRSDGSVRWIENKIFPTLDASGNLVRIDGLSRDVTTKMHSEKKLRESNERFELVTRATSDAIWDWNFETNQLYWSGGYEKLFGYKQNITNLNIHLWVERIHPEDLQRVTDGLWKTINGDNAGFWEDEYRYKKADGAWAFVYDRSFLVYDDNGRPIRMVGAMQDISKRKMAELNLLKSQANLRTIFDNTNISYVLLDCSFGIVSFNAQAHATYKMESGKLLAEGRNMAEYMPPGKSRVNEERNAAVLRGETVRYEMSFARADGSLTWYSIHMFPVMGSDNILGIIVTCKDITTRKNAELEKEKITQDLIQRNKDLEQFAYIISHNLRSPVANIIGLSGLILHAENLSDSDYRRSVEGMMLSVQKLDNVIIDLNYILQVRREINEKKEMVRFADLVSDIQLSISNLISKENVTIITDFSAADGLFTLKSYINSIFFNLISNSIKYRSSSADPVIEVRSTRTGNKIALRFRDNGMGIDMKLNGDKIFGLYKKFHPHTEGKGMGLYMVKTQAEILGGKISIHSEVDKGTEFLLEFEA